MKSPFPGMDPYLEQHWGDIHSRCIIYSVDHLQEQLPGDLRARAEERICLESDEPPEVSMYPDVMVVERGGKTEKRAAGKGGAAVAEPLVLHLEHEPPTERFIEIIDVSTGHRVVTVIEFLSLSNKLPGKGMDRYWKKQRELREGKVSLVEIDLLRLGQRVLAVPSVHIPASHRTTYQVCVSRGWRPGTVEIYRVPLRERLPTIKIPLRKTDKDVPLDLQEIIDKCYRNGRYDDLDYSADPIPPLNPADAKWADALLRKKGLRK